MSMYIYFSMPEILYYKFCTSSPPSSAQMHVEEVYSGPALQAQDVRASPNL